MFKTIGIIGAGMIGGNVARLSTKAGFNVIICNSRSPETLHELIGELGPNSRAANMLETIDGSDLVVIAIPLFAYKQLPVEALKGKIAIDTMNYYPSRDGRMPEVENTEKVAASEYIQQYLKGVYVVKTINNMSFIDLLDLARPTGSADRSAMPIACDVKEVVETVAAYLDKIGYDTVYIGALFDSWRIEPTMPAYVLPYREFVAGRGPLVSKAYLKRLIDSAVRHNTMHGSLA